ncbi:MAG: S-layer homology domain-containing protein [Bacillota bacterium]|nr:S-layer homology domain-containing protein [Bacillota bacterium]
MKRLLICLLTLILCLSLVPAALAAKTFSDVPGNHWAYSYVSTAVQKGWVNGMSDNQYQPGGTVTGAQFLTMVVRAFYPGDIPAGVADPWYQPYVTAGDKHGLRTGAGLSAAKDLTAGLTRYQMAQVMDNLLSAAGVRAPASFDPATSIADWSAVPASYRESVANTYGLGLLTGMDDKGTFAGTSSMNRAQAAAVMCRLGDAVSVQSPGTDPVTPADMVSNQALLNQANARFEEQYYFLYGLEPGAVFDQVWEVAFEAPGPEGYPVPWFRVTEPGMNSMADIQRVWETYFARSWAIPAKYLASYREANGRLYSCNQGIGDDITIQSMKVEKILSRSGQKATLLAKVYHRDPWNGSTYTEDILYNMIWEDGQWKCSGLTWTY